MLWKDLMYFTTSERRGVVVMLVLIIIVLFAPTIFHWVFPPGKNDVASFEKDIREFEKKLDNTSRPATKESASANPANTKNTVEKSPTIKPFNFNPNNLPESSWEKMGLPVYLIRTIMNYEKAGGSFRFKEDLLKIYLMKEEWYAVLEPFIELPSKKSTAHSQTDNMDGQDGPDNNIFPSKESIGNSLTTAESNASPEAPIKEHLPLYIDINKADTLELMQLRGIGSVFSRRIIAYRELLGGYLNASQLLEVYGMDTTRLGPILKNLHFDTQNIHRINLNNANFVDLVRHPYIDRNLANALLSFMKQHQPLDSLEQLRQSFLITDEMYEQISPYLKVK